MIGRCRLQWPSSDTSARLFSTCPEQILAFLFRTSDWIFVWIVWMKRCGKYILARKLSLLTDMFARKRFFVALLSKLFLIIPGSSSSHRWSLLRESLREQQRQPCADRWAFPPCRGHWGKPEPGKNIIYEENMNMMYKPFFRIHRKCRFDVHGTLQERAYLDSLEFFL